MVLFVSQKLLGRMKTCMYLVSTGSINVIFLTLLRVQLISKRSPLHSCSFVLCRVYYSSSSILAYPLSKLSASPSPERQTSKKRRIGKGAQGNSTSVSEIETTVTKRLVEVTNIVAFASGTEVERAKLLATLSSDNLGIFADYTTSGFVHFA